MPETGDPALTRTGRISAGKDVSRPGDIISLSRVEFPRRGNTEGFHVGFAGLPRRLFGTTETGSRLVMKIRIGRVESGGRQLLSIMVVTRQ